MSLLEDAPGRFAALSSKRVTHSVLTVGTPEVLLSLAATTRAVLIVTVTAAPLFYRVDDVPVTTSNGMFFPAQLPQWIYVEAKTVIRLISSVAAQDVRIMEVAA